MRPALTLARVSAHRCAQNLAGRTMAHTRSFVANAIANDEDFPVPAPAAIASGSIVSGDIVNFDPQGDATDPTGCYRLNRAFAESVERHGMTAVHQANGASTMCYPG